MIREWACALGADLPRLGKDLRVEAGWTMPPQAEEAAKPDFGTAGRRPTADRTPRRQQTTETPE